MKAHVATEILLQLLDANPVVDITAIRNALGGVSDMTVFRRLRSIDYRRSYNHNGAYYTLYRPERFDDRGLWHWRDVFFSVDGSLRNTVRRMVHEAPAGCTHRELQDKLRVRTQNSLLTLLRKGEIDRERLLQIFVYLHVDEAIREQQLERRKQLINERQPVAQLVSEAVGDAVIIEVLLTLIHHPGATPAEVVRYLRGHVPPIQFEQVNAVFQRFDLWNAGKKTPAHSIS